MVGSAPNKRNDDLDDWGIPTYGPSRRPSWVSIYRRYRYLVLSVICIVAILYWLRQGQTREHYSRTDWSRFAYVQYATDIHTTCNALMVFEALKRLGSRAERILLYPEQWHFDEQYGESQRTNQLFSLAKKLYSVHLEPTQILGPDGVVDNPDKGTDTSITKLRLFELDQYERILYFDNDVLLQQHMDELFLLPSTPIALPRAYWTNPTPEPRPLSTALMLIQPNAAETKTLWQRLQAWRLQPPSDNDNPHPPYVQDLLNERFSSSALILPHKPYLLSTSEFRHSDHESYLGTHRAPSSTPKWDPHIAAAEAKLIRFDDWPLPKPWIDWPRDGLAEMQPFCDRTSVERKGCAEREVWKGFYEEFRLRRRDVCRLLSVPAPQNWAKFKNRTELD